MVLLLVCPGALVAALRPTKARWLEEGFTPEMNTGAFWVFSICMYVREDRWCGNPNPTLALLSPTPIHHQINAFTHTGLTSWAFFSWMHPLFAAAKQQQRQQRHSHAHQDTTITLDLDRDIYPLPLDARAAEASARLLELRARRPGESLWRSVFRLGKWAQ